jgi:hypothetical protein
MCSGESSVTNIWKKKRQERLKNEDLRRGHFVGCQAALAGKAALDGDKTGSVFDLCTNAGTLL